jgi:phage terminase large subunit GpA-like protein
MKLLNSTPQVMGIEGISTMMAEHHPIVGKVKCPKCGKQLYLYSWHMVDFIDQENFVKRFLLKKSARVECRECLQVSLIKLKANIKL